MKKVRERRSEMKRYTFVTTYIIKAPNEAKARETVDNVESQLRPDRQVVENWTKLTDVEDAPEEVEA